VGRENKEDLKAEEGSAHVCVAKGDCEDQGWWNALAVPCVLSGLLLLHFRTNIKKKAFSEVHRSVWMRSKLHIDE